MFLFRNFSYGAGIVGSLIGGTGVVKASLNIGDITSEGGSYACGIVGGMQRHSSIEAYNYSIDFCDNYGDITSSGVGAAGIVGTGGGQIQNCYNYGKVTAGGQYAGGILACSNNEALTMKKCYNFGEVTGSSKTAGIAGELRNEATVLDGCYNVAVVEDGHVRRRVVAAERSRHSRDLERRGRLCAAPEQWLQGQGWFYQIILDHKSR